MATTDLATVIATMRSTVRGLTPDQHAGARFVDWDSRLDTKQNFRQWCDANPTAAFRQFVIRQTGTIPNPAVSNIDVEEYETEVECTVAYPIDNRAGVVGRHSLDALIRQDDKAIHHAIGTPGYSTIETAGDATSVTVDRNAVDEGTACLFDTIRFRVIWKETP